MRTVILALGLFSFQLGAQNLVLNPGFEDRITGSTITIKPGMSWFDVYGLKHWSQPTGGSSDYYYKNGSNFNTTQFGGKREPATGTGLVGFIPWLPGREYREYTQGELSAPLQAGKKYLFSMKVCAGPQSPYLVNELGAYFSADKVNNWKTDSALRVEPQIWLDATTMHKDPWSWITIQNVFVAKGGERYVTIGNFLNDEKTVMTKTKGDELNCPYAYFYMDDIVVQLTTLEPVLRANQSAISKYFEPGKTFIARGINFDLDKATLRPESYLQLHEIAAELKSKPALKVDIRGYTDSSGNEPHNLALSKARAKAVADYLISTGIDKSRITYGGYGSASPISKTDPALNRRVEFVFK